MAGVKLGIIMNSFTVYKVLANGSKQLLLVQDPGTSEFKLCVYDEHTGQTLVRLTACTIDQFAHALEVLRG